MHGTWRSEKGRCTIGKDPVTARLSYLEPLGEEKVHGWLEPIKDEAKQWTTMTCDSIHYILVSTLLLLLLLLSLLLLFMVTLL